MWNQILSKISSVSNVSISLKYKLIIGIGALVFMFALGRYTVPVKVVTEIKTVEIEKKTDTKSVDEVKDKKVTTITTDVTKPDGTKEHTVTQTVDNRSDNIKQDITEADKIDEIDKVKEETRESSRLTITALAGTKFSISSPIAVNPGVMVTKDVLGPIHVGAFGLTSGVVGVGVGLSF